MKNLFKLFALLFTVGIFASCEDVSIDKPEIDQEVAQDEAFAGKALGDVFAVSNEYLSSSGKAVGDCGTYNYDVASKTLTITYPEIPCTENYSLKSGVVTATLNQTWGAGSTMTITFDNYSVDGVAVSGTLVAEFVELTPAPKFVITADVTFTFADGRTLTVEGQRTLEKIAGVGTMDISDDSWKANGTTSGVARSGKQYTRTETNLVKSYGDCKWFDSGSISITVEGDDPLTMTFNEGTCGSVTFEYKGISITKTLN